jgi:hypothetical protein
MKLPVLASVGALVATLFSLAYAGAQQSIPPAPASPSPVAAPSLPPATLPPSTPTPGPRGRNRAAATTTPTPAASGSETPAPPQFTTLDGVWEVELQTRATTFYSHFTLRQSGSQGADVSGIWDQGGNPDKKLPLTGTFDGRLFKFTATLGQNAYTFTGYVENYSDIVGMVSDGKNDLPFTAQHRKKEKFLENITPSL